MRGGLNPYFSYSFDEDGSFLCEPMAKSIRSKVKKRLRSVKRGVLKKDLQVHATC